MIQIETKKKTNLLKQKTLQTFLQNGHHDFEKIITLFFTIRFSISP